MMAAESPSAFVLGFVRALESSDTDTVRASFDADIRAYITNAEGGTDLVEGSDALGQRFPDFAAMADSFRATVSQVHEIDDGRSFSRSRSGLNGSDARYTTLRASSSGFRPRAK